MKLKIHDLHLYLSKESEVRTVVREIILPKLSMIDIHKTEIEKLEGYIDDLLKIPELENYSRQTKYAIIDFLLVNYYDTDDFDKVVEFLFSKFRSYIVIHELAAMSWGDKLLVPAKIFGYIDEIEVSQKHLYHILNEMSVTYPVETINYTTDLVDDGKLSKEFEIKLHKKMINDRKEGKVLSKGVQPQMSKQELQKLV